MWLRIVTAAAALVSAAVHLILWVDGYRDISVIGPAFLVNAVAGVVIAVLLVTWWHWLPAFLVAGFGASTLGAFVLSATVGLFGVPKHTPNRDSIAVPVLIRWPAHSSTPRRQMKGNRPTCSTPHASGRGIDVDRTSP